MNKEGNEKTNTLEGKQGKVLYRDEMGVGGDLRASMKH